MNDVNGTTTWLIASAVSLAGEAIGIISLVGVDGGAAGVVGCVCSVCPLDSIVGDHNLSLVIPSLWDKKKGFAS